MSSSLRQRSLFGDCIFLAFIIVQFLDGALTYFGVRTFGAGIEANPIVGWYMAVLGVGGALIATKGLAVLCAALLHRFSRHQVLGVLTVVYLAAAVRPWVNLLTLMN
jgi:nitrate reductase gamma subunit